jgi:hypothetical protein
MPVLWGAKWRGGAADTDLTNRMPVPAAKGVRSDPFAGVTWCQRPFVATVRPRPKTIIVSRLPCAHLEFEWLMPTSPVGATASLSNCYLHYKAQRTSATA